jgi:hypothetical protein
MGHHDDATEHPLTDEHAQPDTAAEPAVKDGTDPNDLVVSDDIDQEMLEGDIAER